MLRIKIQGTLATQSSLEGNLKVPKQTGFDTDFKHHW
jgi:hypothetical protein